MSAARHLFSEEKLPSALRITQEADSMDGGGCPIAPALLRRLRKNADIEGYRGNGSPGPVGSKGCPATTLGLRGCKGSGWRPLSAIISSVITFRPRSCKESRFAIFFAPSPVDTVGIIFSNRHHCLPASSIRQRR